MAMKSGGPAFPHEIVNNSPVEFNAYGEVIPSGAAATFGGMSLRDYFAAKAMQSIVSAPHQMEDLIDTLGASTAYAKVSETAYVIADAMLRSREAS